MSGYQDVYSIGALPFRGVFDLVNHVVFSSTSAIVVLYLYHLISQVIGSRGHLKDLPVNDKRALGLIATYATFMPTFNESAFMSDQMSRFSVDISINLVYNILSYGLLTRQVQILLTRNRGEADLTGMKRIVTSFCLIIFCQLCALTLLCHDLAINYSIFMMRDCCTFLMLPIWMLALLLSVKCSYTSRD